MPLLFSYGTLQQDNVQTATFGRRLAGAPDAIVGYARETIDIDDADVVARSGSARHPIVVHTGWREDRVEGRQGEDADDDGRDDRLRDRSRVRDEGRSLARGQSLGRRPPGLLLLRALPRLLPRRACSFVHSIPDRRRVDGSPCLRGRSVQSIRGECRSGRICRPIRPSPTLAG